MLYYHNEITGNWTTSHKEAVSWYNQGYAVELNKVDPETGALEKCAEWVWQGTSPTPSIFFRHFAQYICGGHCMSPIDVLQRNTNVLEGRAARFRPLYDPNRADFYFTTSLS